MVKKSVLRKMNSTKRKPKRTTRKQRQQKRQKKTTTRKPKHTTRKPKRQKKTKKVMKGGGGKTYRIYYNLGCTSALRTIGPLVKYEIEYDSAKQETNKSELEGIFDNPTSIDKKLWLKLEFINMGLFKIVLKLTNKSGKKYVIKLRNFNGDDFYKVRSAQFHDNRFQIKKTNNLEEQGFYIHMKLNSISGAHEFIPKIIHSGNYKYRQLRVKSNDTRDKIPDHWSSSHDKSLKDRYTIEERGYDLYDYTIANKQSKSINIDHIIQIFECITFLHTQNVVHRDIRMDNFLFFPLDTYTHTDSDIPPRTDLTDITKCRIKLTDFGTAMSLKKDVTNYDEIDTQNLKKSFESEKFNFKHPLNKHSTFKLDKEKEDCDRHLMTGPEYLEENKLIARYEYLKDPKYLHEEDNLPHLYSDVTIGKKMNVGDLKKRDIYSFGILLRELINEGHIKSGDTVIPVTNKLFDEPEQPDKTLRARLTKINSFIFETTHEEQYALLIPKIRTLFEHLKSNKVEA